MGQPLDLKELQMIFKANPNSFIEASLLQHIPRYLKKVGNYPKKIQKKMPLDKFKNYFVKIVYGVQKEVGKDWFDKVWGVEYIIARDVQDSYHACEYDYVSHILDIMKKNIARV